MTALMFYKYIFMTELLVAEGLFTFRMEKRRCFPVRTAASIAVCYAVAALYPLPEWGYNGWYTSIMFLALFFVTIGAMLFVYDTSFKNAFFCGVIAYTAQHLAYEIYKLMFAYFDILVADNMYGDAIIEIGMPDGMTWIRMLVYLDVYIVVFVLAYFFLGKKIMKGEDLRLKSTSMLVLSAMILLVDIILNATIVYITEDYNKKYDIVVGIYNCLCCFFVLNIQRNIIDVKDIKDKLETVSLLLQQATRQYALKKEEINLINIKCHDLKHRINRCATVNDLDSKTIAEIEDMISIYDATVKTGNEVLDIILTEKSLVCQSKNIKITCMADCSKLGFISEGDLYALFGNILDNAIEAVSEVADEEKRCIGVYIHSVGGNISVMAENYFTGSLVFANDNLPVTKKRDKNNHGFGLKSIELIVGKYGGNMSVSASDDIFRISIMIPLADDSDKSD